VLFTLWSAATLLASGLFVVLSGQSLMPYLRDTSNQTTIPVSVPQPRSLTDVLSRHSLWLAGALPIGLILVYLSYIGPYLEVPADIWAHLGSMQELFNQYFIDKQPMDGQLKWFVSGQKGLWYFTLPWLSDLLNARVELLIQPLSLVNSAIFLTGIYLFSLHVLKDLAFERRYWLLASALSVGFCFLHFGVNIFSYIRYYVAAPAFLNYLIFLGTILIFCDVIRGQLKSPLYLCFVSINLVSMLFIHLQELLFTGVMLIGLSLYFLLRPLPIQLQPMLTEKEMRPLGLSDVALGRALCWAILGATVLSLAISFLTLNWVAERKFPFLIPLSSTLPVLKHLYVSNPTFQPYHAVTIWGLVVYLLCLVRWRFLAVSPILLIGMLSPVITLFNPLFVEFFLRFSTPEPFWRFIYVVPLYLAGGAISARLLRDLVQSQSLTQRIAPLGGIVILLVLLMPLSIPGIHHHARTHTLQQISPDNTSEHWNDLFIYLRSLPERRHVLTDPITGYQIRGLTPHDYFGIKYEDFSYSAYKNFNENLEQDDAFDRYVGWLFVVNQREGGLSENGRLSNHWTADKLRIKRYYSDDLFRHLKRNRDRFRVLWRANNVTVYEIRERPL
tara:strand:+ start:560 stop:2401 length:1842 start_codon:yes stop_codon:yes gene_type:complete